METTIKTKAMVESALAATLIIVMTLLSNYLTVAFVICTALSPVIIAITYYRNGFKYAICCAVVSALLSAILLNPMTAITMAISYTLTGIALGYFSTHGYKANKVVLIVTICCIISLIAEVILYSFFMGVGNPIEFLKQQVTEMSNMLKETIEQTKNMASGLGVPEQNLEALSQYSNAFSVDTLLSTFPAAILFSGFVQAILCMKFFEIIAGRVLKRTFERLDIARIYISNLVGAAFIGISAIITILINMGYTNLNYLFISVILLMGLIIGINGLCTVEYFLKNRAGIPSQLRAIIIILLVFMAPYLYLFVGFIEMILDFRKLDPYRIRKA